MSLVDKVKDWVGGSTQKMEYILGGALAVIIVAAVVMMIRSFWGGTPIPQPDVYHMYCSNCKAEKVLPKAQMEKLAQEPQEMPGIMRPKCPDCGKNAMIPERHCPACDKWYVTQGMITGSEMFGGPPGGGPRTEICPNCKVDIGEWIRTHPRK